jgi:hypothetical protein
VPNRSGPVKLGEAAPNASLNLQSGELVRVKTHQEILATLTAKNMHRGILFDVEMVPFCGGVYRVRSRVERFIDEKTGKIKSLKTPAVILEGVWCKSAYSTCRMFCPRALYSWWREVWLERVVESGDKQMCAESGSQHHTMLPKEYAPADAHGSSRHRLAER